MDRHTSQTARLIIAALFVVTAWLGVDIPLAQAVPSMGRQTGYQCSKCHTVFPELTPFGRQFKLGGFAMSSDKWDERELINRLPLSGALQVARTRTSKTDTPDAEPDEFPQDRKTIVQLAAVYYGGKITDKSGALVQYNYDGIEKKWGMEMFDARYADGFSLGGKEVAWGLTLNNNPTVSDIYNSTSAWGFPHTETAAEQMPAATLIDMTLASQAGGVGAYAMWNDLVYAEIAAYRTLKSGALRFMGLGIPTETVIDGYAPYWRLALQQEIAPHSFAIGTYGMVAKVFADGEERGLGTDRFRDIGFDANYQYIQGPHTFSARANWIREKQKWNASFEQGLASNRSDTLKTFRTDAHYYYNRKWGGGLQLFRTRGSTDDLRYNTGEAVEGSSRGSPDSRGWTAELNYVPWQNLKLALRYTAYQKFNGAKTDYVPGRDAKDNDSLFLLAWLLF